MFNKEVLPSRRSFKDPEKHRVKNPAEIFLHSSDICHEEVITWALTVLYFCATGHNLGELSKLYEVCVEWNGKTPHQSGTPTAQGELPVDIPFEKVHHSISPPLIQRRCTTPSPHH